MVQQLLGYFKLALSVIPLWAYGIVLIIVAFLMMKKFIKTAVVIGCLVVALIIASKYVKSGQIKEIYDKINVNLTMTESQVEEMIVPYLVSNGEIRSVLASIKGDNSRIFTIYYNVVNKEINFYNKKGTDRDPIYVKLSLVN